MKNELRDSQIIHIIISVIPNTSIDTCKCWCRCISVYIKGIGTEYWYRKVSILENEDSSYILEKYCLKHNFIITYMNTLFILLDLDQVLLYK